MAISARGFTAAIGVSGDAQYAHTAETWALLAANQPLYRGQLVLSGLGVTGGANQVQIASGAALLSGLHVSSSATETVAVASPSSTRSGWAVLEADWAGSPHSSPPTAARTVTAKTVIGSSVAYPTLTYTPGTLVQMPLARLSVDPSGVVTASPASPQLWVPQIVVGSAVSSATIGSSATRDVSTADLPDRGWPFRIEVHAKVRVDSTSSGVGTADVVVSGAVRTEGRAFSARLGSGAQPIAFSTILDGTYWRAAQVRLRIGSNNLTSNLDIYGGDVQRFVVKQIPAA